jgi:hypothetical protein
MTNVPASICGDRAEQAAAVSAGRAHHGNDLLVAHVYSFD